MVRGAWSCRASELAGSSARRISVRSGLSAQRRLLGLEGRGRIRAGNTADLAIFDPETIIDRSDWDYPNRFAVGVEHVLVNGARVLSDGEMTGAAPGRVIRRGGS
ncbi:MAG: amidohydrolase family protein [Planctomycetota bacterium]|nr:amidohydrolase family protein [Planctomycetota bacterium]